MRWAVVVGMLCVCILGCTSKRRDESESGRFGQQAAERIPAHTLRFGVNWPLVAPSAKKPARARTLLSGLLRVTPDKLGTPEARLVIGLTLTRSQDETARQFWNESLAYREYAWMDRVRVWDTEDQWLYPNLPFLFRLHGIDRIDRYGGWDPGKNVDNDFGAVLIRKYRGLDGPEHPDTVSGPLVSAAWHAADGADTHRRAVVHQAETDAFTIHLVDEQPPYHGRVKLWLVYGDFMGEPVPRTWPAEPEFDGGTIAFFHIDWHYEPGSPLVPVLTPQTPEHTGFAWQQWVGRRAESELPTGTAKLTDRKMKAKS